MNSENEKEIKSDEETYKIDVDCANCANKMEEAAKNTAGVKDCNSKLHDAENDR